MQPSPARPLRVALLVYRGTPYSGGLGVYVRNLSRALARQGHRVTVFAGQPYPDVHEGVELVRLASLDLYRQPDPFRIPKRAEFRDWIDVLEFGLMLTGTLPEPLTFSLRARRELAGRTGDFDVVHDNSGLGYGTLALARRVPVVATIHHAMQIDRRLDMDAQPTKRMRMSYGRWYAFVRMQERVARRLPRILTVSGSSREDIVREYRVDASRVRVVPNGVDTEAFRPLPEIARVPGRILTTASSDVPLKGVAYLLEALAKVRTDIQADLVVVGKPKEGSTLPALIERFGLAPHVRFVSGIDDAELAEEYARAEVAVVPSLYEGFSLPAVEAMGCGVPLVATTGGALPEVVGDDGLLVPPADAGALAGAIGRLLTDGALRRRLGAAGRARVLERYTWDRTAAMTADVYREVAARTAAS